MKKSVKWLWRNAHWILLALAVIFTVCMDVYIAGNLLDSDTADDVRHGWVIAQENNPLSTDIYCSTEVRLLDIATVFSLFFRFTQDWTLVRILGTVLMQGIYVAGFLYLCRQSGVGLRPAIFSTALLLSPFSTPYARIVLYHLYYILYLANAFWIAGLTLRLLNRRGRGNVPAALLLGGLWIFVGLNGVRHMLIIGIPMLAFAAVQLLLTLSRYRWERGRLVGEAPFFRQESVRLVLILAFSCVCFLIGYVGNVKILLPHFGAMDSSFSEFQPNVEADRFTAIYNGWLMAIGTRYSDLPLVGLRGVSLIAALLSFGFLLTVSFRGLTEPEEMNRRMGQSLLAASFTATTLIFLFESGQRDYELYYVPVVAMAFPVLAQEMERLHRPAVSAARKLLILLCAACLAFQGAYTAYFVTVDKWDMDDWNGMPFLKMDVAEESRELIAFMRENGYTYGMVDYWYANVMMELSNGEIVMAPLYTKDPFESRESLQVYHWGTSKTAFARENLPDTVIVFITREKVNRFESVFPEAPRVYEAYSFNGYEVSADCVLP